MSDMPADDGNPPGGNEPGTNDPGADTAMFRAYVEQSGEPPAVAPGRTLVIGLVIAIVVLALIGLLIVAS
jgi:hypothetical protein